MKFFYFIVNFIAQFFLTLVLGTTVSDVHIRSKKQKKVNSNNKNFITDMHRYCRVLYKLLSNL